MERKGERKGGRKREEEGGRGRKGGRKREYELGCCFSGANHLVSDKESLKRQTVGQARPAD